MKTPQQVVDILKKAFHSIYGRDGSYGEIAYAAGVAQLETSVGDGWGNDSHNWGAVTGTYNGQYFEHKDSHPDGKGGIISYTTKFRSYPSDVEGAADFLKVLYKETHNKVNRDTVRKAANRNSFRNASKLLYNSGYYSGTANVTDKNGKHDEAASIKKRIDTHVGLVENSLKTGRFKSVPASYFGKNAGISIGGLLIGAVAGLFIWKTINRPKRHHGTKAN